MNSKTCLNRLLKIRQKKGSLIKGRKYCRTLPLEHSAILSTLIKRKLILKTNFLVALRVADLDRFYFTINSLTACISKMEYSFFFV